MVWDAPSTQLDAGSLFADSPLPSWVYDARTLAFLRVNEAAVRTYGYTREQFARMTLYEIVADDDADLLGQIASGQANRDLLATRRDGWHHRTASGELMFVRFVTSGVVPYAGHDARVAVVVDVSDVRMARADVAASRALLAYVDPVVALPNRAALAGALAREALPPGTAVFAVRIDYAVPAVGDGGLSDDVARCAAKILREILPVGCSFFSYATDVVVAMCPSCEERRLAQTWADQIVTAFITPLDVGEGVVVNARVGYDLVTEAVDDAATAITHALSALRHTAAAGPFTSSFTDAMHRQASRAHHIERLLRGAPPSEFAMAYQPVVSLRTGRLTGVEALLRWTSREIGAVSPAEFIPVAERSGFITELGARAIDIATRDYAAWRYDAGPRPKLMLNVSAQQLRTPALYETLLEAVTRTGMALSDVDLELTETAMVEQVGAGVEALSAMRRRGARICLDDFGMGYSSLSYLTQLPLDVLKIDRSFVSGMRSDPVKGAVVRSVIEIAHTLGATAIGEGVEEAAEAEMLRELDCDAIQGYWIARPAATLPQPDQFAEKSST